MHKKRDKQKVLGMSFLIVLLLFNPSIQDFQKWLQDTYDIKCSSSSCYVALSHPQKAEETKIDSRSFLFFSIFSLQSQNGANEEKVLSILGFFIPYPQNQADGMIQQKDVKSR